MAEANVAANNALTSTAVDRIGSYLPSIKAASIKAASIKPAFD
jgi:hypothetical protein